MIKIHGRNTKGGATPRLRSGGCEGEEDLEEPSHGEGQEGQR